MRPLSVLLCKASDHAGGRTRLTCYELPLIGHWKSGRVAHVCLGSAIPNGRQGGGRGGENGHGYAAPSSPISVSMADSPILDSDERGTVPSAANAVAGERAITKRKQRESSLASPFRQEGSSKQLRTDQHGSPNPCDAGQPSCRKKLRISPKVRNPLWSSAQKLKGIPWSFARSHFSAKPGPGIRPAVINTSNGNPERGGGPGRPECGASPPLVASSTTALTILATA
jgi:hypothetical protein